MKVDLGSGSVLMPENRLNVSDGHIVVVVLALELRCVSFLFFKQLPQFSGEWEYTPLVIFGRAPGPAVIVCF